MLYPATGFRRKVEGTSLAAWGFNTCTGPVRARTLEVGANTSCSVVVKSTGPG